MSAAARSQPSLRQTEEGCLALADISGYTSYLAGSELDHAQDVLEDLTQTVVSALTPPLRLAKLEGDAAFVYAPGNRIDAAMLLDAIDAAYFAFRRRQDAIDRATQCECNACVLIPRLDLKFVVHHGRFGRQYISGREELSGSDVIVVHRLLKNRVAEVIGHTGYAFYTDASVAAMGVAPEAIRFARHTEQVDDVGSIEGWVQDLHGRWTEERERHRVKVGPDEAHLTTTYELSAPPSVAWSYLTDPELRRTWQPGVLRVDQATQDGRRGAGTTNHCIHGRSASLEEILDWRPFDYFTIETRLPLPLVAPVRMTQELEATPTGSRITQSVAHADSLSQRLIWMVIGRGFRARLEASNVSLAGALLKTRSDVGAGA